MHGVGTSGMGSKFGLCNSRLFDVSTSYISFYWGTTREKCDVIA
jgi:hypothetical protein